MTTLKTLVFAVALFVSVLTVKSQSVTNLQIVAIIKLSNGQSYTNSASSNNTNHFAAFTNAMEKLNFRRINSDPQKPAVTNLSQAFIEINKEAFKQYKDDHDGNLSQLLSQKLPTMSEADKDLIRSKVE